MGLRRALRNASAKRRKQAEARLLPSPPTHPLVGAAEEPLADRDGFLAAIDKTVPTLEIGAYYSPCMTGPNIKYFDVFDTEELKRRARQDPNPSVTEDTVIPVDYVDPTGDLSFIPDTFKNAFSSHCIEHQTDLIRHLRQVHDLLEDGGRYYVIAPNKLYCFDQSLPETTIGEVIQAHRDERKVHTLRSTLNTYALTTHNRVTDHWIGKHDDQTWDSKVVADRLTSSLKAIDDQEGGYVDAHAWQFTPVNFARMVEVLWHMGLSPLKLVAAYETPFNRPEFTAILERPAPGNPT